MHARRSGTYMYIACFRIVWCLSKWLCFCCDALFSWIAQMWNFMVLRGQTPEEKLLPDLYTKHSQDQTLRVFHLSYFKYVLQITFSLFQFISSKIFKFIIFNLLEVCFPNVWWNRFLNEFFWDQLIIYFWLRTYLMRSAACTK